MNEAAEELRQAVAGLLQAAARQLGDERFARAAGALLGRKSGRRRLDDSAPLDLARALLASGAARSRNEAARMAAETYARSSQIEAMHARLFRKLRTQLVKSGDSRG